jgi:hypothetical protein
VNLGSVACRLIQRSRKSCPTFLLAGRMRMMLELANADKKLRLLCPGLQPEWSFQRSETAGPTDQEQFAMAAVSLENCSCSLSWPCCALCVGLPRQGFRSMRYLDPSQRSHQRLRMGKLPRIVRNVIIVALIPQGLNQQIDME